MPQYGVQGSMLYTYQKNKYAQYIVKGCDFNMCFTFVVGLEDNVNDSWIVTEALCSPDLNFPHSQKK